MHAIIHVGDQKCGSKSIQDLLWTNRSKLASHGILYPQATKVVRYDAGLSAIAGDKHDERVFLDHKPALEEKNYVAECKARLLREIDQASANKIIFSYEGLLHLRDFQLNNLTEFLNDIADSFEIVMFLRRQDRKAVSGFTTRLLHGEKIDHPLRQENGEFIGTPVSKRNFDYLGAYNRWKTAFPSAQFTYMRYEDHKNTAKSFCESCGIQDLVEFSSTRSNQSTSERGQRLLFLFNSQISQSAPYKYMKESALRKVREGIRSNNPGKGLLPTEREAREHYAIFEKDNDELASLLNQGGNNLFDTDFSSYPSGDKQLPEISIEDAWQAVSTITEKLINNQPKN